jgi:iron complex outermembrane receptor protein
VNNKTKYFGAAVFLSVLWSPFALAQELEEIVITAQRRSQDLNDVPIAVNAFQASDIADLGISDITLLAGQSPNLSIKYAWGNSMPIYTIRGVGMNSFQGNDTASVGLFVDEVFQTSIASMGAFLYDIERVEVLKGPQGTLFGRNTNGGAVNYLTRAPNFEDNNGYVRAEFATFDRHDLEFAYGGAINDKWAARGSVLSLQSDDGWVYDRTSNENIGEVDILAARGQLLYQHSDTTSARFILFASRDRSQPVYFQHIGTIALDRSGACQAFREGRLDPNTCMDVLGYRDTDNDPYAGDYTDRKDTFINSDTHLVNDNVGATLLIDSEIGGLGFRSITSMQYYDRFQPKESDGNPALFLDFLFASQIEAFSQEFRISSDTDGRFSWIAGVQLATDTVEEKPDRIGYLDDLGVRYGVKYEQERTNIGAYMQGLYNITDTVRLEVGGRMLYDDVDFYQQVYVNTAFATGGFNKVVVGGCPDPRPNPIELACALDDTAFTGKIGLDWSPNEDMMIYGSVSSGYKPGGFNGGLNTNSELNTPYDAEEVFSVEVGLKSTLWNGRAQLNMAIFDYSYQGLQAQTARPAQNQAGVLNFLTNLSDAEISGAEIEFRAMLTENLEVNLGIGLLNTKNLDPGANFNGPFGNSTRKLANSPEETINASVAYEIPLGNDNGKIRLFTDFSYDGENYKDIVNVQALKVRGKNLNAKATWFSEDEKLQVYLFGRNLSDEVNVVDTLGAGGGLGWAVQVISMPRVLGMGATYNF